MREQRLHPRERIGTLGQRLQREPLVEHQRLVAPARFEPREERIALVVGAEGDGLSARTVAAADVTVRIPMAGGVDSLNVASAAAVAFWATAAT
jgi:tRNA G18 (ribose-2'-O)-methylase SpoU